MTTASHFLRAQDLTSVEMLTGVHRRTMAITDGMMLCEVLLEKDAVVPQHQHIHEQVGYVVYGTIEMTIADETQLLGQGDSYAIPSNVPHSARAITETVVIDVFNPPREEYR